MNNSPRRRFWVTITNTFGAFGYFFGFLEWFWVIMLYFSVIQSLARFVAPTTQQQVQQAPSLSFVLPGPVETAVIAITTVLMVALSIYVLIKIPSSIVKTGRKMVQNTSQQAAPLVIRTQHKKDTKKTRLRITAKLIVVGKLLIVALPIIATLLSCLLDKQSIDYTIAVTISCGLATFSMVSFVLQYTLAKLFRVPLQKVW